MFRLKRILFPTDFTRCAHQALEHALQLAKDHRAELHMLHAVVAEGQLAEGDQIVINIGDRSQGGPGTITSPVSWNNREIYVQVDPKGDDNYTNLGNPLLIDFLPGKAARFEVVVASISTTADEIAVVARAEDIGSNIQPEYEGIALATFQDASGRVTADSDLRFTVPVQFATPVP